MICCKVSPKKTGSALDSLATGLSSLLYLRLPKMSSSNRLSLGPCSVTAKITKQQHHINVMYIKFLVNNLAIIFVDFKGFSA